MNVKVRLLLAQAAALMEAETGGEECADATQDILRAAARLGAYVPPPHLRAIGPDKAARKVLEALERRKKPGPE